MRVRLVVPRLADGGDRDRLWKYCRAFWAEQLPEMEIVEGHHEDDSPFNRSAAINRAAEGEWDVAVILDSDTIIEPGQVKAGIARAATTGRLTLPFKVRCLLNRQGTARITAGYVGSWKHWIQAKQTPDDAYEYISGCQIVPRALWDEVGGFDERFEGWGGEDDAFHAACMALAGQDPREDRLEGDAWHLWHRRSPDADHRTSTWKQAKALSDRYLLAAEDWNAMRALLAEPRSPEQVAVVVLTAGDRPTLGPTIESAEENLAGPIGRKVICVDQETTDIAFEGWDVIAMGRPQGYVRATRNAHYHAIGSGQPWIFHLEDDFLMNEQIDLWAMQAIMGAHPELCQLSLKRQPWYEPEVAAGGIIEVRPAAFTQRDGYVEHRAYWTSNPMLVRRSFIAANEWPGEPNSELRFGRQIFRDSNLYGGILGEIEDPPRVHHIGAEQAGYGY
jgi:N-terminal domain of galactosyltransferase